MSISRVLVTMALAFLLASATASASVTWPYQLDPAFSSNGYDTQEGAAQKLALLGDDTIVAVTTPRTDGAGIYGHYGVWIDLLRYGPNGQLKPWTGATGSPTRLRIPAWNGNSRYEAVRDIGVSAAGYIYVLMDIRIDTYRDTNSGLYFVSPDGQASGLATVVTTLSGVNDIGAQMMLSGSQLLVLVSHQLLPADDPWYVNRRDDVEIRAFKLEPDGSPSVDATWGSGGTNGRTYSYNHCGLVDPGDPPPTGPCGITGTHLMQDPYDALYVAGSVNPSISSDRDVFLLKLNANGSVMTTHGIQGWVVRGAAGIEEEAAGVAIRLGLVISPGPIYQFYSDVFLLSAMQRACGEGLIVYQFSREGTYLHRTWTHGGGGDGVALCDSIRARDMVMVPNGPTGAGQLAIVGEYVTKPAFQNDPQGHAAMLLTLDPDDLANSQTVQQILGGGIDPYDPWYGFRAVRYDSSGDRLVAVGDGVESNPYGDFDVALIAQLKVAPLFSDGFED